MPLIHLVRHGEPAGQWGSHPDPGLSVLGHEQARAVSARFTQMAHAHIISSPLARCRETAVPTTLALGRDAIINKAVAEIPVPKDVSDHRAWLGALMKGSWDSSPVTADLRLWRDGVGEALIALQHDTIVFSHFVAINAAVGLATQVENVVIFQPGHASVTVLETSQSGLRVVELGQESAIRLT